MNSFSENAKANSLSETTQVPAPGNHQCYDPVSIRLHWITAALVVALWGIAQVIDLFPKGTPKITVRSLHIILGVTLAFVLLTRIYWRMRHGRRLPRAQAGVLGYLAQGMHYVLYVALAATLTLGIANVWVRGDTVIGLFTVPKFAPGDKALKDLVEGLHGTFANTILILAGVHALAALFHHFLLRNTVLRRMLPGQDARRSGRRDR
jgi:cytochrome b561